MTAPVVLIDFCGRSMEVLSQIGATHIAIAHGGPIGAFVFVRTAEVTGAGRRVYRQTASAPSERGPEDACDIVPNVSELETQLN